LLLFLFPPGVQSCCCCFYFLQDPFTLHPPSWSRCCCCCCFYFLQDPFTLPPPSWSRCCCCCFYFLQEPFTHESLLLDRKDQKLTRREKRLAKQGYEMEKKMSGGGGGGYSRPSYAQFYPQGGAGADPSRIRYAINNTITYWSINIYIFFFY